MTMTDLPESTSRSSRPSELLDVGEVQAGGRLVEDVDAALLGHAGGQLEPLALTAGQRGERLAEAEVAQPHVGQPVEDLVSGGRARLALAEERLGLGHRHREHLADVLAAEGVLEHLGLEALALALLAGGGDAGHDPQVGVDDAGAVAGGARALGVGAEQRGLDAVGLRERLADRVEQPGVGRRVAPPRAADRGLVDRDDAVALGHRAVDQRALARARHPGDDDQHAERDVDVDVLQVVRVGAAHLQRAGRLAHLGLERRAVVEVAAGDGAAGAQPVDGALEDTPRRPRCRRRGRGRRRGRRSRSPPACARRPAPCCPCRAAAAAARSSAGCRAGAGRSWARRRRR